MKATIKKSFAALVLPAFAALALLGTTATSDASIYVKIPGIPGDVTSEGAAPDHDHEGWIQILSVSQSVARALVPDPTTGQMRRRGDVILEDITCSKMLDKASPKLAQSVCTGAIFPEVEIHFTRTVDNGDGSTSEQPYLTYKLKDVMISSYSFHGNSDGDPPTEEVTFGYTEIEWTYTTYGNGEGAISYVGFCDASTSGTP